MRMHLIYIITESLKANFGESVSFYFPKSNTFVRGVGEDRGVN